MAVHAKLVIMSLVSWLSLDPMSSNTHGQYIAFLDLIVKKFEIKKNEHFLKLSSMSCMAGGTQLKLLFRMTRE